MKNQKIFFISYATKNFKTAGRHLIRLAKKSNLFEEAILFSPNDLSATFKEKYAEIIKQPRGAGYWIWKHRIIKNLLNDIAKDDIVVYCDAGASINLTKKARSRYFEYISMLNDSEYSNFRMQCEEGFVEKFYTYKEIFDYFNIKTNSQIGNSLQYQAGHMIFKNNEHSKNYFNEYELFLSSYPYLITDSLNKKNQIDNFIENRHDQSIFSILSKTLGSVVIPNETEFRNRLDAQYNYPFLSVRAHGHGPKDYLRYYLNPKKFTEATVYFK